LRRQERIFSERIGRRRGRIERRSERGMILGIRRELVIKDEKDEKKLEGIMVGRVKHARDSIKECI